MKRSIVYHFSRILVFVSCSFSLAQAQRLPDHIYMETIHTVKLYQQNDQQSTALLRLNGPELLELHFDDMGGYPRNFFYTFQLCNADWSPAMLNPFDYIKGFLQNRITQYRVSSIANNKYVHYQALLPERNAVPSRSGNYLLKVFLDGDTAKLAFTKRFMVVDERVNLGARILQPFNSAQNRTHQKIQVTVNTGDLNILSPQQQSRLIVLQNNRWDNAAISIQPTFIRGKMYEYSNEQELVFASGKEYRWADLQSFRFLTDRMDKIDRNTVPWEITMKPDLIRNDARYAFFVDRNGLDEIGTAEGVNPWWQGDYAWVHFSLVPDNRKPMAGKDVFLLGSLTGNQLGDTSRLQFDEASGLYRKTLLLKQGYYSYQYVTRDKNGQGPGDPALTEGNYWETENDYQLFFYFRSMGGRHDELVGVGRLNSRLQRN